MRRLVAGEHKRTGAVAKQHAHVATFGMQIQSLRLGFRAETDYVLRRTRFDQASRDLKAVEYSGAADSNIKGWNVAATFERSLYERRDSRDLIVRRKSAANDVVNLGCSHACVVESASHRLYG